MRRRPVRKIEHLRIDVTPAPPWLREMCCIVSIGGLIAATNMTAGPADPQMQPGIAQFQAFFTPGSTPKDVADCRDMFANRCHAVVVLRLICRGVAVCGSSSRNANNISRVRHFELTAIKARAGSCDGGTLRDCDPSIRLRQH
jgi:hypothetical protein